MLPNCDHTCDRCHCRLYDRTMVGSLGRAWMLTGERRSEGRSQVALCWLQVVDNLRTVFENGNLGEGDEAEAFSRFWDAFRSILWDPHRLQAQKSVVSLWEPCHTEPCCRESSQEQITTGPWKGSRLHEASSHVAEAIRLCSRILVASVYFLAALTLFAIPCYIL